MATESPRRQRRLVTKTITVPGNLQKACDEFNGGLYFECHETLEEIWQEEQGEVRDCYKGLIQLAAGFLHITRNNYVGANRLLRTGVGYLQPYRASGAMGFDIDAICRAAEGCHRRVQTLGPGRLAELDPGGAPVYAVADSELSAEAIRWQAWGFDRAGVALPMEITVIE